LYKIQSVVQSKTAKKKKIMGAVKAGLGEALNQYSKYQSNIG
jgi:hypothetical protein